MVYKRVTGWTSGRSLPVLNFGYYAELSKYVASSWKYAWTTNLPRFTNACQEVPHFNERLTGCFEKFVYYSIRHIKFIHMEEACWYRETFSKRFIATSLTTKSHKWRSQQKPSHVPRKKTLYSWLQRKTLKEKPKARSVSSICSKNVQYHDWRLNSRIWAMGLLLIPGTSTSKRMEQNACLKRDLV